MNVVDLIHQSFLNRKLIYFEMHTHAHIFFLININPQVIKMLTI